MTSKNETRTLVEGILLLLSSKEQQQQFYKKSSSTNLALELLCLWFNELYNPGTPLFKQSFSATEYVSIQEFNVYYDILKGNLPETIEQMFLDDNWNSMMQEAKILLDKIK